MNKTIFWKNFIIGKELDIAGAFIYNALNTYHYMNSIADEMETFEFLYYVSVGLERLLKISIILVEHTDGIDEEAFYKRIVKYGHNHSNLIGQLRKNRKIDFSKEQNAFINLINVFYNEYRYDRYNIENITVYGKERAAFVKYLFDYLGVKSTPGIFPTQNSIEIKNRIGSVIGGMVEKIYQIIVEESKRLGIFIDEFIDNSKPYKIFVRKEYDFYKEDLVFNELLIYLRKNSVENGVLKFIDDNLEPLEFDYGLIQEYINGLKSDLGRMEFIDELDTIYDEDEIPEERKKILYVIGNPIVDFNDDPDDEY